MNQNCSENLIFEITKELVSNNPLFNQEQIHNAISRIIVKYQVVKLAEEDLECNLQSNIELYISARQIEGYSSRTIDHYKKQLDTFSKDVNKNVEEISTAHVRNHLSKYEHLKKSSLATKMSVIKSFFVWLLSEEIIQKDPTKKLKTPKFNKYNPKYLTVDELEMLREACRTPRERSMLECLYATGARLTEVHNMNIKDIDFTNFSAKVIGKGNKERDVFFSLKAIHYIKKYLETRTDKSEALFVSERKPHGRLSGRGIQREIDVIAKNSTVEKNISPHVLRHTMASLSLNNNMDISVISSILGHSQISTTQIYAHVSDENKRYQYKKHLVL
jgi:integrase/recombinase XerD